MEEENCEEKDKSKKESKRNDRKEESLADKHRFQSFYITDIKEKQGKKKRKRI